MTRQRGNRLQNALAAYLRGWWPHAESAGAGRQGTDVLGTPGVVWECKTARDWQRDFRPQAWIRQAKRHAQECNCDHAKPCYHALPVPVVVYFPDGIGEANTANTLAIVPLHVLMQLLIDAGHAPARMEAS